MESEPRRTPSKLRLVTWNINGLRTFPTPKLKEVLDSLDADIICLQETRVTRDTLEEPAAIVPGYDAFFSFTKTSRGGYSGVATYCRGHAVPIRAEEGLTGVLVPQSCPDAVGCYGNLSDRLSTDEMKHLDFEGRAVITQHQLEGGGHLSVINVYCPRVDPEKMEQRLAFKLQFYNQMYDRARNLHKNCTERIGDMQKGGVIILGDLNCSHKPEDHCDPQDLVEFMANPSRQWMNTALTVQDGFGLVDSFRHFQPDAREAFTCWNTKLNARSTNYGTRIDYILCDQGLVNSSTLTECSILSDVLGSDHCPVRAGFDLQCISPPKPPSLCARFFPEFVGTQQTLKAFLRPSSQNSTEPSATANNKPAPTKKRGAQTTIAQFFTTKTRKNTVDSSSPTNNSSSSANSCDVDAANVEALATSRSATVAAWRSVLGGAPQLPLCDGHKEPCVLRTVRKAGPNLNKQFYSCARGEGRKGDPQASCNFFKWVRK